MQSFEIAADGDGLADHGSVVELQHRHLTKAVARQVLGLAMPALAQADMDLGNLDPLLGQEDPHAARIGRGHGFAMELHDSLPLLFSNEC